jgi:hypothetical protein
VTGFGIRIRGAKFTVIPAEAGIQLLRQSENWIPAFAGMTIL